MISMQILLISLSEKIVHAQIENNDFESGCTRINYNIYRAEFLVHPLHLSLDATSLLGSNCHVDE